MRKSRKWKFWLRILLNWCEKYLQINMMKRSISQNKQKQKQQNDIDFANVYCFKFFEFEFFECLLIDAFWLIANSEQNKMLTHRRLTKNCEKDELIWSCSKFALIVVFHFFMSFVFVSFVCKKFIFIDVDCEDVKNETHTFLMSL